MVIRVISEIAGLAAMILALLSFQQKKRRDIMLFQMSASLLFSTQLFLVGAVTGGCIDLISFVRTLIFSNNEKKWAKSKLWLFLFLGAITVTGALTWKDGWSVLPILGAWFSTLALWMKKEKQIRFISLFVGPCWLIYDLVSGAYTGALNEVAAMTSIIIGIIRLDRKKTESRED